MLSVTVQLGSSPAHACTFSMTAESSTKIADIRRALQLQYPGHSFDTLLYKGAHASDRGLFGAPVTLGDIRYDWETCLVADSARIAMDEP